MCILNDPKILFRAYSRLKEFSVNLQLTKYYARQHTDSHLHSLSCFTELQAMALWGLET